MYSIALSTRLAALFFLYLCCTNMSMTDALCVTELCARLNQLLRDYNLPITKTVRPFRCVPPAIQIITALLYEIPTYTYSYSY